MPEMTLANGVMLIVVLPLTTRSRQTESSLLAAFFARSSVFGLEEGSTARFGSSTSVGVVPDVLTINASHG